MSEEIVVRQRMTADEILVLLGVAVKGIANFGKPEDAEDLESLLQLRSAANKLRMMVGMDFDTFMLFCRAAAGEVSEEVVKAFLEDDAKRKSQ